MSVGLSLESTLGSKSHPPCRLRFQTRKNLCQVSHSESCVYGTFRSLDGVSEGVESDRINMHSLSCCFGPERPSESFGIVYFGLTMDNTWVKSEWQHGECPQETPLLKQEIYT